jgi:hypothetical protein
LSILLHTSTHSIAQTVYRRLIQRLVIYQLSRATEQNHENTPSTELTFQPGTSHCIHETKQLDIISTRCSTVSLIDGFLILWANNC